MTQAAFPKLPRSQIAFDLAGTIYDGFDQHYRLFREASRQAKQRIEQGLVEDVYPYPQHICFYQKELSTIPAVTPPPFMETLENE